MKKYFFPAILFYVVLTSAFFQKIIATTAGLCLYTAVTILLAIIAVKQVKNKE